MLKTFSGRNASQNEKELRGFISLLKERGVTRYLEIGARHGDTFHEVMINLPAGSCGVAVDLPGGLWGGDTAKHLTRVIDDLNQRGYKVSHLFGNSQEDATRSIVVKRGPYDAILIDGDHTLAGVTRDWQSYGHLAPIVAFHDIVGTGQMERSKGIPVEVPILWESIRAGELQTLEFVGVGSTMGIGVVLS